MDMEGDDAFKSFRKQEAIVQMMNSIKAPEIPKLNLNLAENYTDITSAKLFTIAPEIEG